MELVSGDLLENLDPYIETDSLIDLDDFAPCFAVQSRAASRVQSQGTAEGPYFNAETTESRINNAAWRRAFEIHKETGQSGPPDALNQDIGDTRGLVTSGRCGLMIDRGGA